MKDRCWKVKSVTNVILIDPIWPEFLAVAIVMSGVSLFSYIKQYNLRADDHAGTS